MSGFEIFGCELECNNIIPARCWNASYKAFFENITFPELRPLPWLLDPVL